MAGLRLHCPECQQPSLDCHIEGQGAQLTVSLLSQECECDPYGAWEDVWEEARERVYEHGELD